MNGRLKDLLILALTTIILTLVVWLPHLLSLSNFWGLSFQQGFATIYRNYDGLEYVVIAKTFYDPVAISSLHQSLPAGYFASHFPGYSILIAFFALLFGYLKSMLLVALLSTILAVWAFYYLIYDFKLTDHPLFLSLLFLMLPARWLIVHSVGSSEPLFIFFIICTLYFFMKFEQSQKSFQIWLAAACGFLAQITRPPGILLFIALLIFLLWKLVAKRTSVPITRIIATNIPLIIIPIGLLLIFIWFSISYQDFWAYFKSGDNIHLTLPPFAVFNKHQFWVGDIWLEDIVYIFILGFLGGVTLWKKRLYPLSVLVLTYLAASVFVVHRDISRYVLPISPFVLIAFEKVLTSREFKIILPIIILAIYFYAQNFILSNTAPIPNLGIYN